LHWRLSAPVCYPASMKSRLIGIGIFGIVLHGCASHDGVYSPACTAFTGSTIELSAGRFTWEKFTDEMTIGKNGEMVNPFPGFPLQGSYQIDGDAVQMVSESGDPVDRMYFHDQDQRRFLLTAKQHEKVQNGGEIDVCALALGGTRHN